MEILLHTHIFVGIIFLIEYYFNSCSKRWSTLLIPFALLTELAFG